MNIQVVVSAVKGFAASEGGKAVVKVVKTVGDKAMKGIAAGAGFGALVAGTKIGYKAAVKGVPAVLNPVIQVLDKMTTGEPDFTVTFHKVEEPKKEAEAKAEDIQKPEEPAQQ